MALPARALIAGADAPASQQSISDVFFQIEPRPAIQTARKHQVLVQEDDFADHSMVLIEGWMALSKMLPDGERQIIDVLLPGDFALIGAKNAPISACSVEALCKVRYACIGAGQANGPEPQMRRLRELMAADLVHTQARTAELMLRMGKGSAATRVAYALLEFYVRLDAIGLVHRDGYDFPMTQQQLGEFVGLSNVHVCRTMRRLERDGIIAYPKTSRVVLNDIDALCQIAGIDLTTLQNVILMHSPVLQGEVGQ